MADQFGSRRAMRCLNLPKLRAEINATISRAFSATRLYLTFPGPGSPGACRILESVSLGAMKRREAQTRF
jgi:hypothetical protein